MSDSAYIFDQITSGNFKKPVAVFDLDSTLYGVSGRTQQILFDLSKRPELLGIHSPISDLLKKVQTRESDWGIEEPLRRLGLLPSHPAFPLIRRFWRKHFFSDRYLEFDHPYPGAVDYVNSLHEKGVDIFYLTSRDHYNMRTGTLESLKKWKFPAAEQSCLHMKDRKGTFTDESFKSHKLSVLKKPDHTYWFFENEPVILQQVEKDHPDLKLIFIDTVHSGKGEPPGHLLRIPGKYAP